MRNPVVHKDIGHILVFWEDEQVRITTRRIRTHHSDGRVTGELLVETNAEGYANYPDWTHLHQAQFNFVSSTTRERLEKYLSGKFNEFSWYLILEQLCMIVLRWVREGESVVEIDTSQEIAPPKYLLYPLLPLNQPTIVFGDSGVGKSELALIIATCIRLPYTDNTLGLEIGEESGEVLYLDYETDDSDIGWRLKCLQRGFELPDFSIRYRYCALPVADDVERIQQIISEVKAKLIIVDSLGMACGGDLNAADVALRFFNAIRSLKTTTLIVAHTSKDPNMKAKTIFGSAFFKAAARSVWECRNAQETGEDEINVALFHRKANISRLHPPMGFKFLFSEDKTRCKRQDVKGMPEFRDSLSASVQIREVLKGGAMTTEGITEETGLEKDTIRRTLNRMKDRGQVIKVGAHQWGLPYEE